MGHRESQGGPSEISGQAIGSLRGAIRSLGGAIGSLRMGHWESLYGLSGIIGWSIVEIFFFL